MHLDVAEKARYRDDQRDQQDCKDKVVWIVDDDLIEIEQELKNIVSRFDDTFLCQHRQQNVDRNAGIVDQLNDQNGDDERLDLADGHIAEQLIGRDADDDIDQESEQDTDDTI